MDAYLSRQLPVITTCIEFSQKNLGPTPIITPQIDFAHNASKNLLVEDEDVGMMEGDTVDALLEKTPDHDDTLDILAHLMKNPTKIPKPIGEPGRPRSGGYCLEAALGNWGDELFHAVNIFIKGKADEDLDTTQSYSKQDKAIIETICVSAGEHFPILQKYQGHWPVKDMTKLYLKYTSESHRKERTVKKRAIATRKANVVTKYAE